MRRHVTDHANRFNACLKYLRKSSGKGESQHIPDKKLFPQFLTPSIHSLTNRCANTRNVTMCIGFLTCKLYAKSYHRIKLRNILPILFCADLLQLCFALSGSSCGHSQHYRTAHWCKFLVGIPVTSVKVFSFVNC